jgi:hypothetical protein
MRGVSEPGNYAPIVIASEVHVVGSLTCRPTPRRSLAQLMTGADDGQWIEVEGVVHSVERVRPQRLHCARLGRRHDPRHHAARARRRLRSLGRCKSIGSRQCSPGLDQEPPDGRGALALPVPRPMQIEEPAPPILFIASTAHQQLCCGSSRASRLSIAFTCGGKSHCSGPDRWIYIQDGSQGLFIPTVQKTP